MYEEKIESSTPKCKEHHGKPSNSREKGLGSQKPTPTTKVVLTRRAWYHFLERRRKESLEYRRLSTLGDRKRGEK